MLSDLERKIHRILYNYSHARRRMPSMHELTVKTGKSKGEIQKCLIRLEDQLFISWDDKRQVESIKILQGWEIVESKAGPIESINNIDYWTQH
ncbi:hypothetical protein [Paenibacillus sp. UASWS1643]|uniref:hypothetical protein n=1 Tax=Paenibacillus sp. UASWS1643 TaxID=2580422 RepID=UPI0012399B1B|nr:hypothetical protein [Paenibacillus sp. UASWS1643]KAA8757854.1 hypothetical protein FE296_00335 [Paenibacillus sp. UASWS1643]